MRLIIILLCTFSFFNCTKEDNPITCISPPVVNEPPTLVEEGVKYLSSYLSQYSTDVVDLRYFFARISNNCN